MRRKPCRPTLRDVIESLRKLGTKINLILKKENQIMATIDDLQAVLDAIPPVLDAIVADETQLMADLQALKDQIANGSTVTEAQVQSALDKATAIKGRLDAIDVSQPVPAPAPVP